MDTVHVSFYQGNGFNPSGAVDTVHVSFNQGNGFNPELRTKCCILLNFSCIFILQIFLYFPYNIHIKHIITKGFLAYILVTVYHLVSKALFGCPSISIGIFVTCTEP